MPDISDLPITEHATNDDLFVVVDTFNNTTKKLDFNSFLGLVQYVFDLPVRNSIAIPAAPPSLPDSLIAVEQNLGDLVTSSSQENLDMYQTPPGLSSFNITYNTTNSLGNKFVVYDDGYRVAFDSINYTVGSGYYEFCCNTCETMYVYYADLDTFGQTQYYLNSASLAECLNGDLI